MSTDIDRLSPTQLYHRVLLDIAAIAAVEALGTSNGKVTNFVEDTYEPGDIHARLLAECDSEELRRRVSALANSAVGSLALQDGDLLAETARKYGILLPPEEAHKIAEHFQTKRNATLSYQRGQQG